MLVWQRFANKFSATQVPRHNSVRNLIVKFWETVLIDDDEHCAIPAMLSQEKLLDISYSMQQSARNSLRKILVLELLIRQSDNI